jgi:hypothetical protein
VPQKFCSPPEFWRFFRRYGRAKFLRLCDTSLSNNKCTATDSKSTTKPKSEYSLLYTVFCPSWLVQSGNFSVVNQSFHLYFFGTFVKKITKAKKLELFVHGSSFAFEISIRTLMRFHISWMNLWFIIEKQLHIGENPMWESALRICFNRGVK